MGAKRTKPPAPPDIKLPTRSQIRDLSTAQSFERGEEYYGEGSVISARVSRGTMTARVRGTEDYHVSVQLSGTESYSCTCPYSYDGICKHIVAVLLHASENLAEMVREGEDEEGNIDAILAGVSAADLQDFVRSEMEGSEKLRGRFLTRFGGDAGRSLRDYRREINEEYAELYRDVGHGTELYPDDYLEEAKRIEESGDLAEAARAYMEISAAIADNVRSIDESDGGDLEYFEEAVRRMASCMRRQNPDHREKRTYISYLFGMFLQNHAGYWEESCRAALEEMCTGRHDLEYWRGLLKSALSAGKLPMRRSPGRSRPGRLERMDAYLLERLEGLDSRAGNGDSRRTAV